MERRERQFEKRGCQLLCRLRHRQSYKSLIPFAHKESLLASIQTDRRRISREAGLLHKILAPCARPRSGGDGHEEAG